MCIKWADFVLLLQSGGEESDLEFVYDDADTLDSEIAGETKFSETKKHTCLTKHIRLIKIQVYIGKKVYNCFLL